MAGMLEPARQKAALKPSSPLGARESTRATKDAPGRRPRQQRRTECLVLWEPRRAPLPHARFRPLAPGSRERLRAEVVTANGRALRSARERLGGAAVAEVILHRPVWLVGL